MYFVGEELRDEEKYVLFVWCIGRGQKCHIWQEERSVEDKKYIVNWG